MHKAQVGSLLLLAEIVRKGCDDTEGKKQGDEDGWLMGPQAHQQPQSALPSLHPQHTGLGAASKLHPGLCLSSAAGRLVPSPLPCCSQFLHLSLTWGLMCHLAFALWLLGGQQNRLLSPAQLRVAVPSMVGLCSCWRDHCPA